jgi:hypothetical protein
MKLNSATLGAALWPAFLGAAVGDAILFTFIDPASIMLFGVHPDISRPGAYTVGFFVLWLLMIATSVTTLWLNNHRIP